jgi:hypothetical protein
MSHPHILSMEEIGVNANGTNLSRHSGASDEAYEPEEVVVVRITFPSINETANDLQVAGFILAVAVYSIKGTEECLIRMLSIKFKW